MRISAPKSGAEIFLFHLVDNDISITNIIRIKTTGDGKYGMIKYWRPLGNLLYGQWHGVGRLYVETFYPSSKLCSCCGVKNDLLTLSDRIYKCLNCGAELCRDLNASIVLEKAGSSFVSAHGGSKVHDSYRIRWESLKCEQNRNLVCYQDFVSF